jgi:hypothetical protein
MVALDISNRIRANARPSVLSAPASLIGSELSSLLGSDLSICLALMPQGYPCTELHRKGERPTYAPPSPPCGYQSTYPS